MKFANDLELKSFVLTTEADVEYNAPEFEMSGGAQYELDGGGFEVYDHTYTLTSLSTGRVRNIDSKWLSEEVRQRLEDLLINAFIDYWDLDIYNGPVYFE